MTQIQKKSLVGGSLGEQMMKLSMKKQLKDPTLNTANPIQNKEHEMNETNNTISEQLDKVESHESHKAAQTIDWDEAMNDMSFADGEEVIEKSRVKLEKPSKEKYLRVNPAFDCHLNLLVLTDSDELNGTYLIPPGTKEELKEFLSQHGEMIKRTRIYLCTYRDGKEFIMVGPPEGSKVPCHITKRNIMEKAKGEWIRFWWGNDIKDYQHCTPTTLIPEPAWSEIDRNQLLSDAFLDQAITSMEHPVVKHLMGG